MTKTLIAAAVLICAVALSGCSEPPELPPAQALRASAAQLARIPAIDPGTHGVRLGDTVTWRGAGRELRLRVVEPTGDGPYPLVVFSHGFASDVTEYDAVLSHWASHGFITIAPFHADGGGTLRAITASIIKGKADLIAARVDDVALILDNLDALASIAPGLPARIDRERIAVAGHSFGAFTAQQFGGASVVDPDTNRTIGGRDARVTAVVALSPPGEMFGLIDTNSWRAMSTPVLATTGTWDMDGRFVTDWRQHRLSFETAQPGHNWLLVIEGADHYLGNLICRTERTATPQHDALRIVNAATTTFLAMQLRDDAAAERFMTGAVLDRLSAGFAQLSHR